MVKKDTKAKAAEKKAAKAARQSKKADKKEKKGKAKGKDDDSSDEDVDLEAVLAEYAKQVGDLSLINLVDLNLSDFRPFFVRHP